MSKFEFLQKIPGVRNSRVRIAVGVVLAIIFGIVVYVIQVSPLSNGGQDDAKSKNNQPSGASQSVVDEIASTAPKVAPVPQNVATSTATESGEVVPPIISNNTATNGTPQQVVDPQYQQLKDQEKMKRLKAGFDAYGSKSTMGTPTTKSASSSPIGGSQLGSNGVNESDGKSDTNDNTYLGSELVTPKSPYLLQAGSLIPSVMISGLNSDISGSVVAQVRENVYDSISGKYLLIPHGSKLVGQFSNQVAYGQNRIAVAWQRLIYPNGYSFNLKGIQGSSVDGFQGFTDQVDNHYWQLFGASFIMGVITAGMQYSQNNTNTTSQIGGFYNPSVGQTMAGSLGQQLGQTGMMITQKQLNVAPTITVRQGYKFTIMMTADVQLKPYKQGI